MFVCSKSITILIATMQNTALEIQMLKHITFFNRPAFYNKRNLIVLVSTESDLASIKHTRPYLMIITSLISLTEIEALT